MKGHGSKSSRQRDEAIVALLTHRNVEEAARAVGIGANTLLRWMKQPEFDAAYREAKRFAFSQSIARLQGGLSAAVSTLLKVMLDPSTPAATKVRAASIVLEHAEKTIDIEDIQARLTVLEGTDAATTGQKR
jgi:transposase-like protein